ncbi:hypothetical protein AVEN_56957-1 [Araneus ventricosus]|uniref:Uncharacterized protein n=1 Tax=Araneus ventricosus TaxID=182803 RepID=A0A4Y2JTC5_ARAVE|nr:hypothetical protein AVEN_56957-1 [Araneus ventricosus]
MITQTCTDLNLTCSLCNITVDLKRSPSKRRYPKCILFSLHFTVKLNRKLAELYLVHPEKKLVAFYTEREREDRALRRKMLIASKKRLLAVHENQRDEIVKNIVYKTPVTSLDELKRRLVTAIQNVTPQMLENTWREIEFRLDVLRATKGSHVQIHSSF